MAGLIDQLIDNLKEQTQRYEELVALAQEKRDVIVVNDIEQLQKINHLENLLINQNQKLERKRMEITGDMAVVLNHQDGELTVSKIIELIEGQEEQSALIEVRDKIRQVLGELSEINHQNGLLVQNALDYIEYSTNVMRSNVAPPANYPGAEDMYVEQAGFIDTKN